MGLPKPFDRRRNRSRHHDLWLRPHGRARLQGDGKVTTSYPNMYYNTDGTTETMHIFSRDGTPLAVVSSTTEGQMLGAGTKFSGMTPSEGQSILSLIDGKTAAEAADLKAAEIVKRVPTGEYENVTYGLHIEVQNIEKIDGGIQIFARAWKGETNSPSAPTAASRSNASASSTRLFSSTIRAAPSFGSGLIPIPVNGTATAAGRPDRNPP